MGQGQQTKNNTEQKKLVHWADMTAERIIKQKGNKDSFTVASGITPSGVVHFGNFREVITVDFVAQALRDRGKEVRFIFSWDDYDTFRKVPKNLPKQQELKKYLYRPIVDTPDPYEQAESYAGHHEQSFEAQLKKVGIDVEPLYQAQKYRKGEYKEKIKKAIEHKKTIAEILNQYRSEPLKEDWWPLSIYCDKCQTDHKTHVTKIQGNIVHYECHHCSHTQELDVDKASNLKLPWRVDWPMRWAHEKVDFEPGGKDHSSQGGSFSTAKDIVKIYDWQAPVYLQYDFVSIKGAGGKMSSSSGNLVTVNEVLEIYTPEMVRWIFASYKSNVDFAVSFDLDVIKTYEDFDRQERLAFGLEPGGEKKVVMAKRVMQLAQQGFFTEQIPFRPSFRHLTNILQINSGDIDKTKNYYRDQLKTEKDHKLFDQRAQCALNWLKKYAPEDFKFSLNQTKMNPEEMDLSDSQMAFIANLSKALKEEWESFKTDKDLHEKMFELIHEVNLKPNEAFPPLYQMLISKSKGPKLAGFIRTIGKEKVTQLI